MNINEISYEVGFSYPRYFSTSFKQIKGMTPTRFKEENKKNWLLFCAVFVCWNKEVWLLFSLLKSRSCLIFFKLLWTKSGLVCFLLCKSPDKASYGYVNIDKSSKICLPGITGRLHSSFVVFYFVFVLWRCCDVNRGAVFFVTYKETAGLQIRNELTNLLKYIIESLQARCMSGAFAHLI